MKKQLSMMLIFIFTISIMQTTVFAEDYKHDDFFNNDLFTVIGEVEINRGEDGLIINDPEYEAIVNNVDELDITKFNDGIIYKEILDTSDPTYVEFDYKTPYYVDVNDNKVFNLDAGHISFPTLSYNLGYFVANSYNFIDGDTEIFWSDIYVLYDTTSNSFINEYSNLEGYTFDGFSFITGFSDNGYAFATTDPEMEHGYKIRLKSCQFPTVQLDGKKLLFDQIPVIENGRTLVPLRKIFESIGAEVSWDESTGTITATKDTIEIKLTVNSNTAYKNGQAVSLDVPAKVLGGRTLVPVRFIADCFGIGVDWDGTYSIVKLTSK